MQPARYRAHSLRAGTVTAAIEADVPESLVMLFAVNSLARAL